MNNAATNNRYLDFVQTLGLISMVNDYNLNINLKEILAYMYFGLTINPKRKLRGGAAGHLLRNDERVHTNTEWFSLYYFTFVLFITLARYWKEGAGGGGGGREWGLSTKR